MEHNRRRFRLAPDLSNLFALEAFIGRCDFLDAAERLRATLVATEYFDNIVAHSRGRGGRLSRSPVEVTVTKRETTTIRLRYRTANFDGIIRGNRTALPHFEAASGRYRGLGLRMCRNLSSSVRLRKGLLKSSIIIIL